MPCAVPSALLWSLTPAPAIFTGGRVGKAQPLPAPTLFPDALAAARAVDAGAIARACSEREQIPARVHAARVAAVRAALALTE